MQHTEYVKHFQALPTFVGSVVKAIVSSLTRNDDIESDTMQDCLDCPHYWSDISGCDCLAACRLAHWEEEVPTVLTSPKPTLLYDYYGFPPESYKVTYPCPGAPDVAQRVRQLLEAVRSLRAATHRI
jgi:hypothetical protein